MGCLKTKKKRKLKANEQAVLLSKPVLKFLGRANADSQLFK